VLGLISNRLVYVRRTRLFASLALRDAYSLEGAILCHPAAAAERLSVVREARELFWRCMGEARALDKQWGL
jgi:hypothetical protein